MIERLVWTPELATRFWAALSQTRLMELSFSRLVGPYLFMLVRQYLSEDGRHLDFGAGDGDFVRLLVEQGVPIAAFEPSASRQAVLASRMGGRFPFLGCIGPDYRGPPFDVMFMFEVIEHILDDELADTFALIRRLLAPDGRLIITAPNNEDLELASVVDPRGEVLFHRWQHVRALNRQSLGELLERFGFGLIVTHEIEFSDRIFAAGDGGLVSRPEFANLFETYRSLIIGNGERLVGIAASDPAAAARAGIGAVDDWSAAPVVVRAVTSLAVPHRPISASASVAAPPPPGGTDREAVVVTLDRAAMRHDAENCWTIGLDGPACGDTEKNGFASTLELYEDHLPLGPRHALHDSIRKYGRGRFSHWGSTLFFSASDSSDPTRNNRCYAVVSSIP
jgi:SAM-dependent methyltransferase